MFQYSLAILCIFIVHSTISFRIESKAGCSISINPVGEDLGEPQPLLLKTDRTETDAFYLPVDKTGTINFKANEIIELVCPGSEFLLKNQALGVSAARAACISGKLFNINNNADPLGDITCAKDSVHTARYTGNNCAGQYKEIEIGFDVKPHFLRHITICFDQVNQNTLYSTFDLTSTIGGYQSSYPRPEFAQGPFYNVSSSVNALYTRNVQRATVNKLLGLPENSVKYIQNNDYYLARGHLTAKADFVYGSQHRLTFYYVNAAPQWQNFNGKNWNNLEQDIRNYAANNQLNLVVHSGTYGVTTLPHETTGKEVNLYLFVNGNKNGLPVPQLFWKVVYNPKTKAGTAFIGVNNPYRKSMTNDIICSDISDQIKWLTWDKTNIAKGYSYACTVDSFRKTVTYLPNFDVTSLLK